MKKAILLLSGFLISFSVFAQKRQQTFGLQLGANITLDAVDDNPYTTSPVISNISGVYYNWDLSSRLGVGIGATYRSNSQKGRKYSWMPENSALYKFSFSYLELPVNFTVDLNRWETAKWKSYLTIGYTYSRLLKARQTVLDSVRYGSYPQIWIGEDKNIHYLTLGFEVHHNFKEKYSLALCPGIRLPANEIYEQEQGHLSFIVKLGRIL